MLKKITYPAFKLEEKKWIITSLAAGIAILAAVISVLVYFSNKEKTAETEIEEDCFID